MLVVERGVHPKERLKLQELYSKRMHNGEKAFVLRQTQSVSSSLQLWNRFWNPKTDLVSWNAFGLLRTTTRS